MAKFTEKKSPERVLGFLGGIKTDRDDRLELVSVSGVAGMAAEVLGVWDHDALSDGAFSGEALADYIVTMAQDSADHNRCNSMFTLRHMRGDRVRSAFTLKMRPQEAAAYSQDDEDATPAGQIRALMAHVRSMSQISQKAPLAAMEACIRLLESTQRENARLNERIISLEKERAKAIDREHELLRQMREIVQPTATEQALEFAQAVPELAKAVPMLAAGIKAIVKM